MYLWSCLAVILGRCDEASGTPNYFLKKERNNQINGSTFSDVPRTIRLVITRNIDSYLLGINYYRINLIVKLSCVRRF